ncbi:MAG: CapA family protein, partial [Gammaproteobacteria bacterium]
MLSRTGTVIKFSAEIAAVLGVAALLASCTAQPRRGVEDKPAAPVVQAPQPPPPNPNGITIAAVGDIMMGTDFPENTLPDDDGVGFLAGVAPVLSAADVAFGNLEGVLMDGGEAVKRCKKAGKKKKNDAGAVAEPPIATPLSPPVPPAPSLPLQAPSEAAQQPGPTSSDGTSAEQPTTPNPVSGSPDLPTVPVEESSATPLPGQEPSASRDSSTPSAATASVVSSPPVQSS